MRRAVLALTLLTLLAGGCENSGTPQRDKARAAIRTFLETCEADRPVAASELLTEALRKPFIDAGSGIDGCRKALGLASLRGVHLVSLHMRPQAATATLRGSAGQSSSVELESSDDTWQLAGP